MRLPKLVIFDCDGVITNTAHLHFLAWKYVAKKQLQINLDNSYLNIFRGLSRVDSVNVIIKKNKIKLNDSEKEQLIILKNEYYLSLIADSKNFEVVEPILNLIMQLKKQNIRIALASVSRNAPQLLRTLKIIDLFDYIVDPKIVANHKPAPDIFLKAANYFGISPKDCWGVEDARIGIHAIKQARMFAIGIGDLIEISDANIKFGYEDRLDLESLVKHWEKW